MICKFPVRFMIFVGWYLVVLAVTSHVRATPAARRVQDGTEKVQTGKQTSKLPVNDTHEMHDVVRRFKRNADHLITDCIDMTSDEGQYFHKAGGDVDGKPCGVYIFAEPDQKIELRFNYVDVPCENGGLVAYIDGWELNGEFFPSPQDHAKPLGERFTEFCGRNRNEIDATVSVAGGGAHSKDTTRMFVSSQNAVLVQYRMPAPGAAFSFTVRFIRNPTPCHTLLNPIADDVSGLFTLRNYGRRGNCSVSMLYPATVRVAALSVGVVATARRAIELETGTLHKCHRKGMADYAEIGGSVGFDTRQMQLADAVCGLDSKAETGAEKVLCDVTTIRLISSGAFDNSVTMSIRQMGADDMTGFVSVNCLGDDDELLE